MPSSTNTSERAPTTDALAASLEHAFAATIDALVSPSGLGAINDAPDVASADNPDTVEDAGTICVAAEGSPPTVAGLPPAMRAVGYTISRRSTALTRPPPGTAPILGAQLTSGQRARHGFPIRKHANNVGPGVDRRSAEVAALAPDWSVPCAPQICANSKLGPCRQGGRRGDCLKPRSVAG